MLAQRLVLRANAPLSRCTGSPILRHTLQRRLASSGGQPPLTGAADNAFNRERLAVKQHAAESSGELRFCPQFWSLNHAEADLVRKISGEN